ncbi:arginine--tRNA ligase, partial [Patescibacteria group bacterium]|nr:arginine--tRNA ligase [Patescibacteria group bacterium]
MIKEEIQKIIGKEVPGLNILVEEPNEKSYGDYSTNIAMVLAGQSAQGGPREIAEKLVEKIKNNKMFSKVEIAGPGFINFLISPEYLQKEVGKILKEKEKYGSSKVGKGQKINVEFISANPTGPLTLGNGRGGFGGDVLSNVLEKTGHKVTREFYINDHGKQVKSLKEGLYVRETRTASQIQKANQKTITKDLKIKFDVWFSEKSLYSSKKVDKVLDYLKKKKLT